ncbi:glycosyltransferase family 4 protein [Anaeromyxobacter oryzae]|uniref:Glycosyl transferase family 1 n=1 Tax=Anaeromyxobacter oryzae TaxID=2918170 RepID=A0ABM7WQG8_9BACT|nr:glycosyltransferase family 1 protein [Anaeromyxobacter oryzae]BDG01711.1 glycosyl transferase family 1 [Anaeromyxobacter oryzae]
MSGGDAVRIGIDATLLRPDRLTGVERHALSLLTALARADPRPDLVVFVRPDAPAAVRALPFRRIVAPFTARVPVDQAWLPLAARRAHVDVLHTLAFPTPVLWRGPAILTVHDATPWLHPEATSAGMRLYYRPLYPQALARAAAILTVSEASRRDLADALGLAPGRIHVTPNGVDGRFFEAHAARPMRPYLLAVGTVEPRKNLPVLVEAFRRLRRDGRELELVIAGRRGWAAPPPHSDLVPHVRIAGPVPDEALPALYAAAACFVQPSRLEGFGLALAEAMAAGVPAVASDIAAHREVGGPAVAYADPSDPDAFAAAIAATLDDPTAARARATLARARARGLTWDACAAATLRVYRAVAAARAGAPAAEPRAAGA